MITPEIVNAALARVCRRLTDAAPELNALDGKLGDGDLGATLEKCAARVADTLTDPPAGLRDTFRQASLACAKASGSSFGTLLAQGLLTAAKYCADKEQLTRAELAELLHEAVGALSRRGGAELGDKTVLDALDAVANVLEIAADERAGKVLAREAIGQTLTLFRDRPNRIGRARMFAERSIGLDDPGMVALSHMVDAL